MGDELPVPNMNYMALDHDELFQNVQDVDPAAASEAGTIWQQQAEALFDFGQDLTSAVNSESASWRGEAAESVFDFSNKIGRFAEETGDMDMTSTDASERSAEAGSRAKHEMPEPTGFDRQAEMESAVLNMARGNFAGVSSMEEVDAKHRQAQEAHRKAAEVSETHANNLYEAHSGGFEFSEPPKLSDSQASVSTAGARVGSIDNETPDVGTTSTSSAAAPSASPTAGPSAAPSVNAPGAAPGGSPAGGPAPGGGGAAPPAPGGGSGVGATPGQAPAAGGTGAGAGGARPGMPMAPVAGAAGARGSGGETPRTNRSPFAPSTGRGGTGSTGGRPGQAGQRLAGGPNAGQSAGAGKAAGAGQGQGQGQAGKAAGAPAGRAEYGARAAQAASGTPLRGGGAAGPMAAGAGGGRGDKDDDKEHKDKYALPEQLDDGLLDEEAGYDKDPVTGHTIVRPVIGEAIEQQTPPKE